MFICLGYCLIAEYIYSSALHVLVFDANKRNQFIQFKRNDISPILRLRSKSIKTST